jgi:hypothetical protein
MLKLRQGLTFQQSPKHPDLVKRFLQGYQLLTLTEGHQQVSTWYTPLGPCIHPWIWQIDGSTWILKLVSLDSWRTPTWSIPSCLRQAHHPCPSFSPWRQKGMKGGGFLVHRRRQSSGRFGKLDHGHCSNWFGSTEVWSQCSMLRRQSQLMVVIYFRLFLEFDLKFQSCQKWSVKWFKSFESY